jgi:hypothetical protein
VVLSVSYLYSCIEDEAFHLNRPVGMQGVYLNALRAMAQPLLHVVGPAVFRAVRQIEQGEASRSLTLLPGQDAEDEAYVLLFEFGRLVLRLAEG